MKIGLLTQYYKPEMGAPQNRLYEMVRGLADKKQVQMMVKTILNLKEVPKPDDTADALAAAICHGHSADTRKRLKELGIR